MNFTVLLTIFVVAWLVACAYYFSDIAKINRGRGVLFFSPKMSSSSRILVKKSLRQIAIATIIFIVAVLIAFFVRNSSHQ